PGVTVQVYGPAGPTRKAEVSIAPDVPAGPVTLTPKTAAGVGAPFTFIVDRYAAVTDAAAIDSAKKGRPVTLPVTLVGTLDRAGQADYFRFAAKAGQQIGAQVIASAVGS